jgi:hypothetical protein
MEMVNNNIPNIDMCTASLNSLIISEMDKHQKSKNCKKTKKKKVQFWNDILQNAWLQLKTAERAFRKCNNRHDKNIKWGKYREAQVYFDKNFRYFKRKHNLCQMQEIDEFVFTNPKEFWNKLNKLGPKKQFRIPMEILDKNGVIIRNPPDVLSSWKTTFEDLFKIDFCNSFDALFLEICKYFNTQNEREMLSQDYISPVYPNKNLTLTETRKQIMSAKSGKACGPDSIPYEVMKNENTITLFYNLIQIAFENSSMPVLWSKAIILPIPKSAQADPWEPLNYRGMPIMQLCKTL